MRVHAPLPGWNVRGWGYGQRQDDGQLHPGADLNVGAGDEDLGLDVVCFADGVVVARREWDGITYGYGNALLVAHELGALRLWSLYAHLHELDDAAQVGATVAGGQRLGACGKSGRQRWAHLHFELRYHGPDQMPLGYWGGGLSVDELSRRYADPYTLLKLAEIGGSEGAGGATAADLAAHMAVLQADRDLNYRIKMEFEAILRGGTYRQVRRGRSVRYVPVSEGDIAAAIERAVVT
jgi:murein DD-endopeptidase MepM/ murein hydrolase activator NlpD